MMSTSDATINSDIAYRYYKLLCSLFFFFFSRKPIHSTKVYIFFSLVPGVHKIITYVNRPCSTVHSPPLWGDSLFFFNCRRTLADALGTLAPHSYAPPSLVLLLAVTIPSTPFHCPYFSGPLPPIAVHRSTASDET